MLNLTFEDSGIEYGMRQFLLHQDKWLEGDIGGKRAGWFSVQNREWLEYSIPIDEDGYINCNIHQFRSIIGRPPIKKLTEKEYSEINPDREFNFMEELQRL